MDELDAILTEGLRKGHCCLFTCRSRGHYSIKRVTRPMLGFKAFRSAAATLVGVQTARMIRKGQFGQIGQSPFKQFATIPA